MYVNDFGLGSFAAASPAPTWLFLGDEFLQGMFPYMRDALAGRVVGDVIGSDKSAYHQWATCSGLPCTGGSRTSTEMFVEESRPPVVVIALGSNPAVAGLPSQFLADVRNVVALAAKFGAQVVVVGPFAHDTSMERLAAIRSVVADAIDGMVLTAGLPRSSDGVHFTAEGYRTLASRFAEAVIGVTASRLAPTVATDTATSTIFVTPTDIPDVPSTGIPPTVTVIPVPSVEKAVEEKSYTVPLVIGGIALIVGILAVAS